MWAIFSRSFSVWTTSIDRLGRSTPLTNVGGRDRTIDKGSRQGARSQCVDLVLHQGDEWRDHQRGAAQHHCGQLITERLAAAGGHNDDGIFSLEDRADHFGLARAETIEAEV